MEVLYPGVPPWLYPTLTAWAEERITPQRMHDMEPLQRIVRVLTWEIEPDADLWREFRVRLSDPDELLDIVHYFLGLELEPDSRGWPPVAVVEMMVALKEAGSAWTVGFVEEDRGDGQASACPR